jgi:hypothetical protein
MKKRWDRDTCRPEWARDTDMYRETERWRERIISDRNR